MSSLGFAPLCVPTAAAGPLLARADAVDRGFERVPRWQATQHQAAGRVASLRD